MLALLTSFKLQLYALLMMRRAAVLAAVSAAVLAACWLYRYALRGVGPGERAPLILVYNVRSYGTKNLTVMVEEVGESRYRVTFALTPLDPGERVVTLYDPLRGYWVENGSFLGYTFPLFRGDVATVLRVKLGERPSLEDPMVNLTLELTAVQVWDFRERRMTLVQGGNRTVVTFDELLERVRDERYVEEWIRLYSKLASLGGVDRAILLIYAHHDYPPIMVVIENSTGIPVRLALPGAPLIPKKLEMWWSGERLYEVAASPLAVVLGLWGEEFLEFTLVDVQRG
ncbi:MAG: hypothetical protein DRJ67_00785 [Thermoprotei archaeon]|nr:MAG: hypothetical protein DRJ67_00785 [Thermoprotei archaeon]